jgi:hypothetical protein
LSLALGFRKSQGLVFTPFGVGSQVFINLLNHEHLILKGL